MEQSAANSENTTQDAPVRHARIWLDTCWLIGARRDLRLIEELHEFIKSLRERNIEVELALTRTVFGEYTSVPDPTLIDKGLFDTAYFKQSHDSYALQDIKSRTRSLCKTLSNLNDFVLSLDTENHRQSAVVLVESRHCQKVDWHIGTAISMHMEDSDVQMLRKLADMKSRYPNFSVEPRYSGLVKAIIESDELKKSLAVQKPSHDLDFMRREHWELEHPVQTPDNFYYNQLFHITAHDWLKGAYPNPSDRGDYSMMSGLKSCNSDLQIILSMDGLKKLAHYDGWHRHVNGYAEVVHPMYLKPLTKALRGDNTELSHFQSYTANALLKAIEQGLPPREKSDWIKFLTRPHGDSDSSPGNL